MRLNYLVHKVVGVISLLFGILGGIYISSNAPLAIIFILISFILYILKANYAPWR